jgi:hypothetical protein
MRLTNTRSSASQSQQRPFIEITQPNAHCSALRVFLRRVPRHFGGGWTISSLSLPNSHYTLAVHQGRPKSSNVLNATLWIDGPPSSSDFVLPDPLLAQLEFTFSSPRAGIVAWVFPSPMQRSDFEFEPGGVGLTASATIHGTPITATFQRSEFTLTIHDRESFEMKKVPKLSLPDVAQRKAPAGAEAHLRPSFDC